MEHNNNYINSDFTSYEEIKKQREIEQIRRRFRKSEECKELTEKINALASILSSLRSRKENNENMLWFLENAKMTILIYKVVIL